MNKKILLSLAAGIALLATSCSGDAVETLNSPVEPSATLKVLVTDQSSGLPIAAGTATMKLTGKTAPVKDGMAEFKSVYVGEHEITVASEGYATALLTARIYGEADADIYVAPQAVEEVRLYPATATLEGYLTYPGADGASLPAAGATVVLALNSYLSEYLEKTEYTAEVEADGRFVFENLPAVDSDYSLTALGIELGGRQFNARNFTDLYSYPLRNGFKTQLTVQAYSAGDYGQFAFAGCSAAVAPNGAIICSFNGAIDRQRTNQNVLELTDENWSTIYANAAWNWATGAITITLPPGQTEWTGDKVNVSFSSLYSTLGSTASGSAQVTVTRAAIADLTGKAVTGVARADEAAITAATETVALKWTLLEGATSYSVYSQCKDDRNAKLMDTYPASSYSGTTASQSVPVKVGQTWVEETPYSEADDETSCSPYYDQYYCSDSYTYWDYCENNSGEGDKSSYFCYKDVAGYWSPDNLPIGADEACKLTVRASNAKSVGAFSEAVTITTAAP